MKNTIRKYITKQPYILNSKKIKTNYNPSDDIIDLKPKKIQPNNKSKIINDLKTKKTNSNKYLPEIIHNLNSKKTNLNNNTSDVIYDIQRNKSLLNRAKVPIGIGTGVALTGAGLYYKNNQNNKTAQYNNLNIINGLNKIKSSYIKN